MAHTLNNRERMEQAAQAMLISLLVVEVSLIVRSILRNQQQLPLLCLPVELRNRIFELALGEKDIP
jgi:hypothetical protein